MFSSSDPSGGAQAWDVATLAPSPQPGPTTIDCLSALLCVGPSAAKIYSSTEPTARTSAWTSTALPGASAFSNDVSCPSENLCVDVRIDGSLATSTDPTGGASAWSISELDSSGSLNAIFCSTQPECFISDSSGAVYTSTNPAGGARAWTVSASPQFESGTCPTTALCVAVDGQDIQTTTDPGAGKWTKHPVADYLDGIACPSASLCLAVGTAGALDVSTNPASGAWTHTTIDDGRQLLNSIACPSASLCVAVDSTGHVVSSTDPTGGASAWTPALIDGDPCADTTPCSVEQIQASDVTGLHTVDSSKISGDGPFLTGLTLTGDVLSWNHDGTERSVTLARETSPRWHRLCQ